MISDQQLQQIEQQLGRKPRGIRSIAYATESGLPVVLTMRSLVDKEPFPTLYWLCSRDLYLAVSRLETEGWVKRLEQKLQEEPELLARYQDNHRQYVARRWQLMDEQERDRIEALGFTELFNRYGIGGIRQWDKVRCLHMHVAHYLAQGREGADENKNVIGEYLERQFGLSRLALEL